MPDFDFDAFNHDTPYEGEDGQVYNNDTATSVPSNAEAIVSDLTETPIEKIEAENAAENTETPAETNNGPVDNGSAEVVEKW
jgi:hypothetical protein